MARQLARLLETTRYGLATLYTTLGERFYLNITASNGVPVVSLTKSMPSRKTSAFVTKC